MIGPCSNFAHCITIPHSGIGGKGDFPFRVFPVSAPVAKNFFDLPLNKWEVINVVTPQSTSLSVERRRSVRQKADSLVCIKLNNGNGGILLNLGTGGLSFQAVASLNRNQNLSMQFKLPDSAEAIQ